MTRRPRRPALGLGRGAIRLLAEWIERGTLREHPWNEREHLLVQHAETGEVKPVFFDTAYRPFRGPERRERKVPR